MKKETDLELETKADVVKLALPDKDALATFLGSVGNVYETPWDSPEDVDKMETKDPTKYFREIVESCRFFYKKDPIVSSAINKMVDIGITDLLFTKETLSDNEMRVFYGVKDKLIEFAENMALEFLISGLVAPEIKYAQATRDSLKELGIKKYENLVLPTLMWLRDPASIKINQALSSPEPSYFVKIPDDIVYFIMHDGTYKDGNVDKDAYEELKKYYPEFVATVKSGKTEILLENPLIFRRKYTTESPYPIPYLNPVLESLKHKRNLRKMDYALASRAIGAIQLIKLGDKDFPLTAEDGPEQFAAIKEQMRWRNSIKDSDRIFQLFGNHTLTIEWVYPPLEALFNETKYKDINQDIIFGLGFPRILITGESERTGTSDPEFATKAPVKTIEGFRRKILIVLQDIVKQISEKNRFKTYPVVSFKPVDMYNFEIFAGVMQDLYDGGNLSRKSYIESFGFTFKDEFEQRVIERDLYKENELGEFAPQPFSNEPTTGDNNNSNNDSAKQPIKKVSKPKTAPQKDNKTQ